MTSYLVSFSVNADEAKGGKIKKSIIAIVSNLPVETIELFAKASETEKGRRLISQGAGFIKGKI